MCQTEKKTPPIRKNRHFRHWIRLHHHQQFFTEQCAGATWGSSEMWINELSDRVKTNPLGINCDVNWKWGYLQQLQWWWHFFHFKKSRKGLLMDISKICWWSSFKVLKDNRHLVSNPYKEVENCSGDSFASVGSQSGGWSRWLWPTTHSWGQLHLVWGAATHSSRGHL